MKSYTAKTATLDAIVDEFFNGGGTVKVRGLFTLKQISKARTIITERFDQLSEKVMHFHEEAKQSIKIHLQCRIRKLMDKVYVFFKIKTHPVLMSILYKFLGTEYIIGSVATNRILSSILGQDRHLDYPYLCDFKPKSHTIRFNRSLPINDQGPTILNPFMVESHMNNYMQGSQTELRHPTAEGNFFKKFSQIQIILKTVDLMLFHGASWNCALPNKSDHDHDAVRIQYLPKWIKWMKKIPTTLPQSFIDRISPDIYQFLGLNCPYPKVSDTAKFDNTIGRT